MKNLAAILLFFVVSVAVPALGAQRYVSDQLVISLRDGAGDDASLIKTLRTGTPLEVLEERGDHLRVRTEDGTVGYVVARYLTDETPKPVVIARLEKEKAKLESRLQELAAREAELQQQLGAAKQGDAAGESAMGDLQQELEKLREQYRELQEQSANVVEVVAERDRLKEENGKMAAEVKALRENSGDVFYGAAIRWFLAGAGVLVLGWLLGRASRGRKRGYSY